MQNHYYTHKVKLILQICSWCLAGIEVIAISSSLLIGEITLAIVQSIIALLIDFGIYLCSKIEGGTFDRLFLKSKQKEQSQSFSYIETPLRTTVGFLYAFGLAAVFFLFFPKTLINAIQNYQTIWDPIIVFNMVFIVYAVVSLFIKFISKVASKVAVVLLMAVFAITAIGFLFVGFLSPMFNHFSKQFFLISAIQGIIIIPLTFIIWGLIIAIPGILTFNIAKWLSRV